MLTPPNKPLILICDDEEGIRESFKLVLEDYYTLHFVRNGMEALEALKTLKPSAMLLDIKMPKLNGMETLKTIKAFRPKLPVVMVTGYQSVETAQEALRNGASDYIPKPFESKHVLKTLENLISNPNKK